MKTLTKILALSLVLALSVVMLASCGAISGTYVFEVAGKEVAKYEFSGNKVKVTSEAYDEPLEYTYEVKDDKITVTMTDATIEKLCEELGIEKSEVTDEMKTTKSDFEKGDGWIKIGDMKLTKK